MKSCLLLISLFYYSIAISQTYEVEEVRLIAHIQTINGVNQKSSDFSPVIFQENLYFTSSRQYNKHNSGENNWDKNSYLNVFYGEIRNDEEGIIDIKNIKLLSNRLNSGTHTGPISFSKTGDTLYLTRIIQVSNGKERLYKAQLFTAVKKNKTWSKIRRLPFSTNDASFSHPSFDSQSNRLYFSSNMAGGKGEFDIYYSQLTDGKWSDPINETAINSSADEKFPFAQGGNIFFSSNKIGGKGQLDVYYYSAKSAEFPVKIEGLNSAYDDFGVAILPDLSSGYFSSNRNGNDDIYYFTLERIVTIKDQISGSFTFKTLTGSAANLTVQLYDENGEFVFEEKTDDKGYFIFNDVKIDNNFSVRLGDSPPDELTLEFYDENGNPKASFLLDKAGAFQYKKLFYESEGIIEFIPDDMKDFEKKTATLSGKIVFDNESNTALSNKPVFITNKSGDIIFESETDLMGNFEFKVLDLNEVYYIVIPDCLEELILYVYGSNDNIHLQLKLNTKGNFIYQRLKPDLTNNLTLLKEDSDTIFMINNSEIVGQFTSFDTSSSLNEVIVRVYNENGILLSSTKTDSLGNFRFNNLTSENTYKFTAESDTPLELTLFNRYGKQIAKIQEEDKNYFIFRPLGFQTDYSLSLIDDEIRFDLNLSERYNAVVVYFNSNETKVTSDDLTKLTRLLKLLKRYPQLKLSVSAYADATASDEYNFILSQKRGEWIVNYLINKGIAKSRFTINAYGETKLVDPENDAVNRRAELRVYQ